MGFKNIKIKSKWILRLDADEIIDKKSLLKIGQIINTNSKISGIIIERKVKFLNKIINYGLTSPHKTLRVWKRGRGKYPNLEVDEQVKVDGKILLSDSSIIDHNLKNFKWWLEKTKKLCRKRSCIFFKK